MGYKLVIAEKPSVAQAIARVIGAGERKEGYLQGNGYLVSWCIGHLVELATPESYDEKYAKWKKDDLPIVPNEWKYQVSSATKKQFQILKKLMNRSDVTSLVNSCDAGREGELIFRLVYHQAGCKKTFERLWISSLEDSAIREGFQHLKNGSEYDDLYRAALCRERADWIVGINATRLFSCLYRQPLNVGRVMTPTLSMVVSREAAIAAFRPEPFYTVQIECDGAVLSGKRMNDRSAAENLKEELVEEKQIRIQKVIRKEKIENPSKLYDLTSLQRDANKLFGYTAQQTLGYTQSLYEKKLVTYPRTDSRYLTDDMRKSFPVLAEEIIGAYGLPDQKEELTVERVINSSRVTDHHAIIPTSNIRKLDHHVLPVGEESILGLIAERTLEAVFPPARCAETTVEAAACGQVFSAKGKQSLDEGYKSLQGYFRKAEKKETAKLPDLKEGDILEMQKCIVKEGKTTPPDHLTEGTLLSCMERADAEWEKDSDVDTEQEKHGIGTPATRAGIIEKLVKKGFLERSSKKLLPTQKGVALITVVPAQIQSPSMTADWEEKLSLIEHGNYEPDQFMAEIMELVNQLTGTYQIVEGAEFERKSTV